MCDWLKNYLDFPEDIARELVADSWRHTITHYNIRRGPHFGEATLCFHHYVSLFVHQYWNEHDALPSGYHHVRVKSIYFNPEIARKAIRYSA